MSKFFRDRDNFKAIPFVKFDNISVASVNSDNKVIQTISANDNLKNFFKENPDGSISFPLVVKSSEKDTFGDKTYTILYQLTTVDGRKVTSLNDLNGELAVYQQVDFLGNSNDKISPYTLNDDELNAIKSISSFSNEKDTSTGDPEPNENNPIVDREDNNFNFPATITSEYTALRLEDSTHTVKASKNINVAAGAVVNFTQGGDNVTNTSTFGKSNKQKINEINDYVDMSDMSNEEKNKLKEDLNKSRSIEDLNDILKYLCK